MDRFELLLQIHITEAQISTAFQTSAAQTLNIRTKHEERDTQNNKLMC